MIFIFIFFLITYPFYRHLQFHYSAIFTQDYFGNMYFDEHQLVDNVFFENQTHFNHFFFKRTSGVPTICMHHVLVAGRSDEYKIYSCIIQIQRIRLRTPELNGKTTELYTNKRSTVLVFLNNSYYRIIMIFCEISSSRWARQITRITVVLERLHREIVAPELIHLPDQVCHQHTVLSIFSI